MRTRGSPKVMNYAGAYNVAKVDPSSSTVNWQKEHSMFGFSASLVYKDFGDGTADLIVGGALDQYGTKWDKEWRLGIAFINDNGSLDGGKNTFYIRHSTSDGDPSSSPYIDHMHLEEVSVPGEDWLFGSTRSLDVTQSGDHVYFWKVKLDAATHRPVSSGQVCTKVQTGGIASTGHVIAVKPTWVGGSMHFVWTDGDNNGLYYGIYNWVSTTSTSIKLYDNIIQATSAVFTGGSSITD